MPAHAQSTEVATGTEPAGDKGIVEVIITAQKRSEALSKAPIAVSAFSGNTLKSQGVVSVADLQNVAPAVSVGRDGFGVNVNIRGVTTTDTTSKGEQGIAFNVDGVPLGRPSEQGLAFFDVQRVEVLRGPQGTLYGKSSTGGAINVISNKPGQAFDAAGDVELGNYNTRRVNLMVNVPLTDQLAIRAAVNSNKRDGFISPNDGSAARNDEDNTSGRLSILYKPTSNLSFLAILSGGMVRGVGAGTAVYSNTQSGGTGKSVLTAYGNPFGGDMDENFSNVITQTDGSFGGVHATLVAAHLHFSANNLTSQTYDPALNGDQYGWGIYRGTVNTDYEELRFSNETPGRFEWVAGMNYSREDIHESDHGWNAPVSDPTVAASVNGIDPVNQTVHTSRGLFAQIGYKITDELRLTLGARESTDQVRRIGTFAAGPGAWLDQNGDLCAGTTNDCIGGDNNGYQKAKKPTWRLGMDYQYAPNQMLYGYVATGYKAGGFNDFDPATGGVGTYEPEELTAYEIGYKGRPFSNLQFNSDVFYYDYTKAQVSSLVNISGNFVIYTRDVPEQIWGWENELHYRPTSKDTIDASLVFERSKYVSFMAGLFQNVDWSGKTLDKTPSAVFTLGYSHIWTLPDDRSLVFHGFSKYSQSYKISDFVNAVQYNQRAFTRSDVTLTYNFNNDMMYFEGYIKNLEDKVQTISAPNNGNVAISEPRMMGIRFGAKY